MTDTHLNNWHSGKSLWTTLPLPLPLLLWFYLRLFTISLRLDLSLQLLCWALWQHIKWQPSRGRDCCIGWGSHCTRWGSCWNQWESTCQLGAGIWGLNIDVHHLMLFVFVVAPIQVLAISCEVYHRRDRVESRHLSRLKNRMGVTRTLNCSLLKCHTFHQRYNIPLQTLSSITQHPFNIIHLQRRVKGLQGASWDQKVVLLVRQINTHLLCKCSSILVVKIKVTVCATLIHSVVDLRDINPDVRLELHQSKPQALFDAGRDELLIIQFRSQAKLLGRDVVFIWLALWRIWWEHNWCLDDRHMRYSACITCSSYLRKAQILQPILKPALLLPSHLTPYPLVVVLWW